MERNGFCCLLLASKTLSYTKTLLQWTSTSNYKTRSDSPFVDRLNISTAFPTTTMGFAQVAPPAPILKFANTVQEKHPRKSCSRPKNNKQQPKRYYPFTRQLNVYWKPEDQLTNKN